MGLAAAFSLLAAVWASPSAQVLPEPPELNVNISDDCIAGEDWPARVPVGIEVRDSGGKVVYPAPGDPPVTARTDASGHFVEDDEGYVRGDCNRVPDLRPGMKVTASDGATTKELILARVTIDQLDPVTDTAAGTAPLGSVPPPYTYLEVYIYKGNSSVRATPPLTPTGDGTTGAWFVNVRALGGDVELGSYGGPSVVDPDGDSTTAQLFVTAVSLSASVPAGPSSVAGAGAAGTTVVTRGSLVRLSGKLSAATKPCVRRKRVKLLKVKGKRRKALESGRTNRRGRYSFIRRVRGTTRFQVRYAGNKRCQRSKSRVKRVRVRP